MQASVELKFGPISYRGPFNVARRPALFVPFSDTKSIATAFDAALTVPSEPMSFAAYQALSAQGDPVLLEMGLKNQAALGRMAYYFQLDDFGAWLWLIRLPWTEEGSGRASAGSAS